MNHLIEQVKSYADQIQQVYVFLEQNAGKILTEGGISLQNPPVLVVSCYDFNRQSVLAEYGDAFGRDGWTRTLGYREKEYDWHKMVNGIKVLIVAAELVPPPTKPEVVSPKEFPLQLTNG